MKTVQLVEFTGKQAVVLPNEFRFSGETVTIRKVGEAIVLEPVKSDYWPEGFFEEIRIDDPAFVRPSQGQMPPAPSLS